MGSFSSIALPLFAVLAFSFPVLLVGAAVLVTVAYVRSRSYQRRIGRIVMLSGIGFALLDVLLLKALPKLGLSYGPVTFILVILLGARLVLYLFWSILLIRGCRSDRNDLSPISYWFFNSLITALIVYGFYIEPFNLQVTNIRVAAAQIDRPLRIVQLSDVHVERLTPREEALIPLVRDLKPDMIVLTGDYLNLSFLGDSEAQQDAQALFRQLKAPYGVFAVNGSVDDAIRMQAIFTGLDITILEDDVERVATPAGEIYLVGVSDLMRKRDAEMLRRLMQSEVPEQSFSLLLYHTPDLIREAEESGVSLYLAGHTHGGQICAPFYGAIVTASMYGKRYESGRFIEGDTTIYVSRGLGMEGGLAPRARFLAPPEVVVIDLVPQAVP